MPHFEVQKDHPTSYAAIRDMILARAEKGPVFFKDMSYYVMPHILGDTAFAGRLTNVFLVRDPVASIPSYHKLDPDLTLERSGLRRRHAITMRCGRRGRRRRSSRQRMSAPIPRASWARFGPPSG
ncbi:MAG: hypothetical protein R3D61_11385 [Defluviimonas denitrificans]